MFDIIDGYDVQATLKQAREKGREEGISQGISQGKAATQKEYESKEMEYKKKIEELEQELSKYKSSKRE